MDPSGIACFISQKYLGATHDFTIFKDQVEKYKAVLAKSRDERNSTNLENPDYGELSSEYPKQWALLADKGYQGAQEKCCAIIPKRKPKGGELSQGDIDRNALIASDRVIVENYFGRMIKLWAAVSKKFTWKEECFLQVFVLCASLTNFRLRELHKPLRKNEDILAYIGFLEDLKNKAETKHERRRQINAEYRSRRKAAIENDLLLSKRPREGQSSSERRTRRYSPSEQSLRAQSIQQLSDDEFSTRAVDYSTRNIAESATIDEESDDGDYIVTLRRDQQFRDSADSEDSEND